MNIWKLAVGIAPAIALSASTSIAQDVCDGADLTAGCLRLCMDDDAGCPDIDDCGENSTVYTTPLGDVRYMDTFGPGPVAPPFPSLEVEQFDPAFYAGVHGVAVSDIQLLRAEVLLTVTEQGQFLAQRTNPVPGSCEVDWGFQVAVTLEQNLALGTPDLLAIVATGEDDISLTGTSDVPCGNMTHEYQTTFDPISDPDLIQTQCICVTSNLANWTGNSTVGWDTTVVDQQTISFAGCNQLACAEILGEVSFSVEVVYTYCVTDCVGPDCDPDTPGCECRNPSPHYRRPGSLLLYPEFDNNEGSLTLFTVTNVDCQGDDVDVEFRFIDADDCSEFNTTITLTPCDTFTAITTNVNPNMEEGYFYAYAKNDAGDPSTHNALIGNALVISGLEAFEYSVNPVSFQGMTADGSSTDLDDDGVRDLDGLEYDKAPDTITIPRFLGQGVDALGDGAPVDSHLILIGLSGGQDFTTTICFDVFNDNEEAFSGEYTFYCWEKPTLLEVRGTFANSFLRTTNHDPTEILGAANRRESGWICIDGCFASSQQETIADPAFYAVLVERISNYSASDLPFECGMQDNGALLPRGLFGDGDPTPENNDNQ